MRWHQLGFALLALILIGLILAGLKHSADTYPGFWLAFVPSLWANVIGVSVGALIGIPVGFAINHFLLRLAEERTRHRQAGEARDLLQHVQREVNLHLATLQRLGQLFPATLDAPIPGATQTTQASVSPEVVASLLLQDVFSRRALSDRTFFELGESLVCFEVSNYYARVGELNRLLNFRIQYADRERPGTWDRAIHGLVQTLWIAQQQVGLEVEQAIDRLARQATR